MSRRKSVSFCSEINLQKKETTKQTKQTTGPVASHPTPIIRTSILQRGALPPDVFFHHTSCFQQHFSVKVCDGRGGKSRRDARGRRRMADLMAFFMRGSRGGRGGSGGDGVPGHEQHSSLFFFLLLPPPPVSFLSGQF